MADDYGNLVTPTASLATYPTTIGPGRHGSFLQGVSSASDAWTGAKTGAEAASKTLGQRYGVTPPLEAAKSWAEGTRIGQGWTAAREGVSGLLSRGASTAATEAVTAGAVETGTAAAATGAAEAATVAGTTAAVEAGTTAAATVATEAAVGAGAAATGAAAGATAGSVVPILGTAAGAVIGAVAGKLLGSAIGGHHKKPSSANPGYSAPNPFTSRSISASQFGGAAPSSRGGGNLVSGSEYSTLQRR